MGVVLKPEARPYDGLNRHSWHAGATTPGDAPTLVCLHPMPYSGAFFAMAAPWLGLRRDLFCPDYPGFGKSEPLPGDWSIEAWADAVGDTLDAFGVSGTVDVLGFHTGCLVGPALALSHPGRVRRLVLVDVPYFDPEQREALAEKTANAARYVGKPVAIRGFRTAFAYDPITSFKQLEHPTLVIGTDSSLHGPSEAAARAIQGAQFLGREDLSAPVFETGAAAIAECVDAFLDEDDPVKDQG